MTTCPACGKGTITQTRRVCDRCGVGVPRSAESETVRAGGHWRRGQDQSERYGFADYAATKEDKQ